jgi:hypothetical protein
MPKNHAECSDGKCETPVNRWVTLPGEKETDPEKQVFQCKKDEDHPCLPKNNCKCYVTVRHFKVKKSDEKKKDPEFEQAEDETLYTPYILGGTNKKLLTKKEYDTFKDDDSNLWIVACRCLKLDDKDEPYLALNVQIDVPKKGYGEALVYLRKHFGRSLVRVVPTIVRRTQRSRPRNLG